MKPHFHKVPLPVQSSFSVRHDIMPRFGTVWHYHPEFELHYVIKGEGMRFIGDNISNFSGGEILLLGKNLPHTWYCKEDYFKKNSSDKVEAIVIHFLPNFMGDDFLRLPEARFLCQLYEKAKYGMVLLGETRERLAHLMQQCTHAKQMDRVILLLSMLNILAETTDFQFITTSYTFYQSNEAEAERLNTICNYTLSHYSAPISLDEIAAISNLTVTSFCRYFKLMTNKTYYDFLTEVRISHACQCLVIGNRSIDQVADQCGFFSTSNFYKQFKKVTGMTPLTYKRIYLQIE